MFERFTREARAAVIGAQTEAARTGSASITEEHLLLSLLEQGALDPLDVDRASIRAGLAQARRRGGLSKADEEALAGLGIDLEQVIARVRETHGEDALATTEPCPKGLATVFGRRATDSHRPFTSAAKQTLEQSLRVALGRKDKTIGAPHLLLALLARPGVVAEVLTDHGVTYDRVERGLA
ncbi:Clp protease N-terminal domain-containing protein [Streptomyces sp. NPDC048603]|uniref:Clp protease N-terminal domain-containing protein n=1 Tax=Streptomyces sp. NPDC048603 TaxID=3365577 RepID=UPI0037249930